MERDEEKWINSPGPLGVGCFVIPFCSFVDEIGSKKKKRVPFFCLVSDQSAFNLKRKIKWISSFLDITKFFFSFFFFSFWGNSVCKKITSIMNLTFLEELVPEKRAHRKDKETEKR